MTTQPHPVDETIRVEALERLELLDTAPDERFDLFTRLAAHAAVAPIALVSLVDRDRQWFKSALGLDVRETPRSQSFCAHAILDPSEPFVVEDATLDPRFADNPLVTGEPGIRFYAGVAIRTPEGLPAGTLCVIDRVARTADGAMLTQLRDLAAGVTAVIELHAMERSAEHLAQCDPLTRLGNRAALERRLDELDQSRGSGALILVDLERFRSINELFGHAAADRVLLQAARRLREAIRPSDLAVRLQEDDFAVLAEGVPNERVVHEIAERLHRSFDGPFLVDGQEVRLGASIGAVRIEAGGCDANAAIERADTALSRAKAQARGSICVWQPAAASASIEIEGRAVIEARLREALIPEGHEPFALAWQPVFDPAGPTLIGFEALVRWPRPGRAPLMPGQFIPIAEATGLIVRLDRWVLRTACREAASWQRKLRISVNLSGASLQLLNVVETVAEVLAETGLEPGRLIVELTETVLVHDAGLVRETIEGLRGLGVLVSLDDFGSGHASLASLRDYRFDIAKIDRAFVSPLAEQHGARVLMRGIVQLVKGLGLIAVAEGVETEAQLDVLRELGVERVQGYLLGKPGVLPAWVRSAEEAA